MSVPGRIGITLIIAFAVVDAVILASGARSAADAIETHALVVEAAPSQATPVPSQPPVHDPLLSTAIHRINLWAAKYTEKPAGI